MNDRNILERTNPVTFTEKVQAILPESSEVSLNGSQTLGSVRRKAVGGYTLVEALVSIVIVLFGVAAAASLSLTLSAQEEVNARVTRALNWHENAVRLYQLGLDTDEIIGILPPLSPAATLEFTENKDYPAVDTLPVVTSTLTFQAGTQTKENALRTNTIVVVRASH